MESSRLPDPDKCRPKHYTGQLWECLEPCPQECPYSLGFGYSFFCRHENRTAAFDGLVLPGAR